MKGFTGKYFQLFLDAKASFIEDDVKTELGSDGYDYKIIYDAISKILSNNSGIGVDSLHTRQQLIIEERLNPRKSTEIKQALFVFQCIRDATTSNVSDFNNNELWSKAIKLALLYTLKNKNQSNYGVPEEYKLIADSLLYLRNLGFKIESVDGRIKKNDSELAKVFTAIDYRVNKLGREGFFSFTAAINRNYSWSDKRYYFYRRRPTIPDAQIPSPPHGYVYNLFCKYLNSSCTLKVKNQERLLGEVQDLSTHLATILDIDKMSPWSHIYVDKDNIADKLTEWVLYPEIFYIPQISPIQGRRMFPRLFELIESIPEHGKTEIVKACRIMEKIEDEISTKGRTYGEFTSEEIYDFCIGIDTSDNIKSILESISKPANNINKNYLSPFDAKKSNIREYPLAKTNQGYFVTNTGTYNIAKYRALLNISLKHHPKSEQRLGFALEAFIKENFDKSNIKYNYNVKYLAPEYVKKISNTNRDQGECDFVIETGEYIYLIEVKKKGITKNSLSGHGLDLFHDATLSFLKSINQLTIAEIILLKDGRINFTNSDDTLILNGRSIFKLVISFEDMASLQCDNIKSSLLNGLYNIQIDVTDSSNREIVEQINKSIDEFTLLHSELIETEEKYKNSPFYHVSYLSTPQLLTLLDDVDGNDDFCSKISRSNTVIYSLMDWYASYKLLKENNLVTGHEEIVKNPIVIH